RGGARSDSAPGRARLSRAPAGAVRDSQGLERRARGRERLDPGAPAGGDRETRRRLSARPPAAQPAHAMTRVALDSLDSVREPAKYYSDARQRGGAVQWSRAQRVWVVLSHAEVESAFRDVERLSADRAEVFRRAAAGRSPAFGEVVALLAGWMNFRDDPAHARLREPVRAAFTPRRVASLEADVRAIVERAIDGFEGDSVELLQAFARPIPARVIASLLGAAQEDSPRFQRWSDDLAHIVFSLAPGKVDEAPLVSATREFAAFF